MCKVSIVYKNHRDEVSARTIIPRRIFYGSTPWYRDKQHFLTALDVDKNEVRDFAILRISNWKELSVPED